MRGIGRLRRAEARPGQGRHAECDSTDGRRWPGPGLCWPRRQDLGARVAVAVRGSDILEQKLGAISQFVPDSRQFTAAIFRVSQCTSDKLVQLAAELLQFREIEQIRAGYGAQHGPGPPYGVTPCSRVDTGRYDCPQRVNRWNDVRHPV